jgi:hypothetical protein
MLVVDVDESGLGVVDKPCGIGFDFCSFVLCWPNGRIQRHSQGAQTQEQHLLPWRMQLARMEPLDTKRDIASIGESVGYQSGAAFHKAFKGHLGQGARGVSESGASVKSYLVAPLL